ncbi:MAG: amino acid permease [Gemmataceae bacterium]
MSSGPPDSPAPSFQPKLGLFDATMLIAGTMIGSGIFIVSADIARDVGSSGWLMAVWIVTGVVTIAGGLAYAELASMMPRAGGQYIFLREAFSPLWGFLYGWTVLLVIQTGSIAAVAVAFAKFLGVLLPQLGTGEPAILYQVKFAAPAKLYLALPWSNEPLKVFERSDFTISAGQLVAVAVIVLLTWLNCRGVKEGSLIQNIFGLAKTLGLLVLIVAGLFVAVNSTAVQANSSDLWSGIYTTKRFEEVRKLVSFPELGIALMVAGGAMVGSLFSADAWNNVTFSAGEVKQPERTVPLALILGPTLVIVLYLLANLAYVAALTMPEIQSAPDDRVATAVMEKASPGLGVWFIAVAVMISTFGCVNGMILMGARLYYAMARDGLFFEQVGTLNTQRVPANGLMVQGVWSVLLVFSGTYSELLDYVIFAALLFYALTVAGLFVLRWRRPDWPRPVRAFGYPVVPAVYMLFCTLLMLDLLIVRPEYTWPGLILVVAGIPVYFGWRIFGRKASAADAH